MKSLNHWVIVFLGIFLAQSSLGSSAPAANVTVTFEVPEDHARAWIPQNKGNITLYSVKENTNQFIKGKKPFVEGHIQEIQMAGSKFASFMLPEVGKYRVKWSVDGTVKWSEEFKYNGVDNPGPFTIQYNGEGVAVTTYEAKNKGVETVKHEVATAHGEHQDLKLR